MVRMEFERVFDTVMKQLKGDGAFLTVQAGDDLNTMTIGWALVGFIWGRPMATVAVRRSRHTHSLLERASEFTISVPAVPMPRELSLCGSETGKKINKLEKSNLTIFPGLKVKTPILDIPGIHLECRITCRTPLSSGMLEPEYRHLYPSRDFHTLYYGEIVECYSTGKGTDAPAAEH